MDTTIFVRLAGAGSRAFAYTPLRYPAALWCVQNQSKSQMGSDGGREAPAAAGSLSLSCAASCVLTDTSTLTISIDTEGTDVIALSGDADSNAKLNLGIQFQWTACDSGLLGGLCAVRAHAAA